MWKFTKEKVSHEISGETEVRFTLVDPKEEVPFTVVASKRGICLRNNMPWLNTKEDMQVFAQILGMAGHEFVRFEENEKAKLSGDAV